MDPIEQLLAERACERLILDFVHRLDLGEPASVAELFTEDGRWEWPPPGDGRRSEGREALRKYFGARPADKLSRRVMSNVRVTVTSADTAEATSYFTTYRVEGWTGGMVPAGPPVQVGHYEDTFRRVDGQWLLASRTLHLPFGGPTPRQGRGALEPVRTDRAPFVRFPDGTEPPLSQGVRSGPLLFVSGQGPLEPATGDMRADFGSQARQVLANVQAVVAAAGGDRRSITRCTCYLSDPTHFAEFNRVYREFFADCPALPARTTVVARLVREGVLVEVDAVAAVG
jgi:reactive intermediate/imine deaminase